MGGSKTVRVDKFLKVSRIIKRRTVAKQACDNERVQINGRRAKAGTRLDIGDELTIDFGHKELKVRVEEMRQHVPKDEAEELYEVVEEIPKEQL